MGMEARSTTRLSTSDAEGRRVWIYPSDVSGRYRRRRTGIGAVLLLIFVLAPWLRIGGRQAVLLDFWNGRFSILGLAFWSHDAPMLLFVFGGAAVLLAFVTSVWGRLWCGWACPQTVFVDLVFRRVERWIEGDAVRRRRLDSAPGSAEWLLKKLLKWSAYAAIALVLSHSFLAYFVGTEALAAMTLLPPSSNIGSFAAMAGISVAVLFDFGWFREQFCTLVCPYGRFQSVLMDENSLAVAYDRSRGDCVDCGRCVHVCPTGIDIRNGLQLECIACTACIDACDTVMSRLRRPPGLIRYTTGRRREWKSFVRPAAYLAVLGALAGGLTWTIWRREPVEMTLIRKVGAPYEELLRAGLGREVVNHFKIDLLNQTFDPISFGIGDTSAVAASGIQVVSAALPLELVPGESRRVDLFVRFPVSAIREGRGRIRLETVATYGGRRFVRSQEVPLVGPLR